MEDGGEENVFFFFNCPRKRAVGRSIDRIRDSSHTPNSTLLDQMATHPPAKFQTEGCHMSGMSSGWPLVKYLVQLPARRFCPLPFPCAPSLLPNSHPRGIQVHELYNTNKKLPAPSSLMRHAYTIPPYFPASPLKLLTHPFIHSSILVPDRSFRRKCGFDVREHLPSFLRSFIAFALPCSEDCCLHFSSSFSCSCCYGFLFTLAEKGRVGGVDTSH